MEVFFLNILRRGFEGIRVIRVYDIVGWGRVYDLKDEDVLGICLGRVRVFVVDGIVCIKVLW